MLHFKHSELVANYHVSLKTVHNWIDSARHGKLDLKLHEQNGRTYIADTPGNIAVMEGLVEKGKKYRNSLHHKVATPSARFYELYNRKQILDIISNLSIHREIPLQYNYFDGGAILWDKLAQRMWNEKTPNLLKSTAELLDANLNTIDQLLKGHDRINVVDIGPGNGLPVKKLLAHLSELGVLHRYIAIDISSEMLHIVKRNIKGWFGDKVQFEGHVRDMSYERFDDILVDDMLDKNAERTINLVLLFGSTLTNLQTPSDSLRAIYNSMGRNDLIVYAKKPDSQATRRYFDFNPEPTDKALPTLFRFIFDLLNIDESLYDVEMSFDEQIRMRYIRVRLKVALTIKFEFKNGERNVRLEKGETILLWRTWHQTALEIISEFEKVGLTLLQASMTKDRQYLLTISGVEAKSGVEV